MKSIELPDLYTNTNIPESKHEFASNELVEKIPHAAAYASNFPNFNPAADTLLLIGRNCDDALWSQCHSKLAPYVYQTRLGWCLVGQTCDLKSSPISKVLKTISHEHYAAVPAFPPKMKDLESDQELFRIYSDDEEEGRSTDDKKFCALMEAEVKVTPDNYVQAPLPLKSHNFPDNRAAVLHRTKNTLKRMEKLEPADFLKCNEIINRYLQRGEIEIVPKEELKLSAEKRFFVNIF